MSKSDSFDRSYMRLIAQEAIEHRLKEGHPYWDKRLKEFGRSLIAGIAHGGVVDDEIKSMCHTVMGTFGLS